MVQIFLKICPSGEITPNLVTLSTGYENFQPSVDENRQMIFLLNFDYTLNEKTTAFRRLGPLSCRARAWSSLVKDNFPIQR